LPREKTTTRLVTDKYASAKRPSACYRTRSLQIQATTIIHTYTHTRLTIRKSIPESTYRRQRQDVISVLRGTLFFSEMSDYDKFGRKYEVQNVSLWIGCLKSLTELRNSETEGLTYGWTDTRAVMIINPMSRITKMSGLHWHRSYSILTRFEAVSSANLFGLYLPQCIYRRL